MKECKTGPWRLMTYNEAKEYKNTHQQATLSHSDLHVLAYLQGMQVDPEWLKPSSDFVRIPASIAGVFVALPSWVITCNPEVEEDEDAPLTENEIEAIIAKAMAYAFLFEIRPSSNAPGFLAIVAEREYKLSTPGLALLFSSISAAAYGFGSIEVFDELVENLLKEGNWTKEAPPTFDDLDKIINIIEQVEQGR